MIENSFIAIRIIDGKPRKVIVDKNGNVVNRSPNKKELKGIDKFHEKDGRNNPKLKISNEELLEFLRNFWREKGRPPTKNDLEHNLEFPSYKLYRTRFGGLQNALRLVGLDTDSMVRKGIIETDNQKARQSELYVLENDEKGATDLSRNNHWSVIDGISKKDYTYDVKSSKLVRGKFWNFCLDKRVDFYYLLGYDKDRKNLLHKWKVPGYFSEGDIQIGNNNYYTYNLENMREYEIL